MRKINMDVLASIGLIVVMYIFGIVMGYGDGYRSGRTDERQSCIEGGTITNFYFNFDNTGTGEIIFDALD